MMINRRSTLGLGLAAATGAIPLLALSTRGRAQEYGPEDGEELYPGNPNIRIVEIGEGPSEIAAYSKVKIIDVVFQPGAGDPSEQIMDMDMVCYITAGEFRITKRGQAFTVKEGDVYTCGLGQPDMATNIGAGVGVHRIALLVPA